ncbi:M48 family metalloprotease [Streptomyces sp. NPDC127084]|uniref:M48 family metalloprotease n=1 Tax=Streptomyces sp. NPDC127084 TaxID=3347133 RepID=UPI00364F0D5F
MPVSEPQEVIDPVRELPAAEAPAYRGGGPLSPTGARYVLLIVTLVLAGAFAGQVVHGLVLGESWGAAAQQCVAESGRLFPDSVLEKAQYETRCIGPLQRRQALVSLAGSAAVLLIGAAGLWLLPRRLMRDSARKSAPARWQALAHRVATEVGVRHVPRVVWGAGHVRQAFTLGHGRRSLIIIPRGMILVRGDRAEAIIRHEIGHIAAGDVTLVWLTRGVWWALVPVLLAPPLVAAAQGWRAEDTSPLGMLADAFWTEYGVRALVLLVIAVLVAQMIMRSREHEADLAAVSGHSLAPWEVLLGGAEPADGSTREGAEPSGGGIRDRSRPTVRGLLGAARADHPTPWRRLAVLRAPHQRLRPTLLDTLVVGLLAAVLLDSVDGLATLVLFGTGWNAAPVSALTAGLLTAVGWSVPVWRDTHARHGSATTPPRWLHLALGASMAAGLLIRLQGAGTATDGPMRGWLLMGILPVAVIGAAALSSAFARRWSRTTTRDLLTVVAVNTLLFGGALWIAMDFCVWLRAFPMPDAALIAGPYSPAAVYNAAALAAIALAVLWSGRSAVRPTRRHGPRRLLAPTLATATTVAAAATRLASQSVATAGGDPAITWQLDALTGLCAGVVCTLALVALRGSGGLGQALYAAPLATVATATAVWTAHFNAWAHPFKVWATLHIEASLSGLALALLILAAPAGLLPTWARRHRAVPITVAVFTVVAAVAAVLALQRFGDALLLS